MDRIHDVASSGPVIVSTLILLRHGQSKWNASNRFAGWVDVALSEGGATEAGRGAQLLLAAGLVPDVSYTSVLSRSIHTAQIVLAGIHRPWIRERHSWRLNERHYGALQGKNKKATLEEYGEEQYVEWRRSMAGAPPPVPEESAYNQARDPRYFHLPDRMRPRTESLAQVVDRLLPYWLDTIVPDLRAQQLVLVTAHSNSLRALIKLIDRLTDDAVVNVNVPTGIPLVYEFDDALNPLVAGGVYLDPDRAAREIVAVANQGR